LPGHLVREIRAARGHDDLATVGFTQDGRHHAGTAKRVGQVWQRLSLRASESCHEEAE
jgi:hypothetical protein